MKRFGLVAVRMNGRIESCGLIAQKDGPYVNFADIEKLQATVEQVLFEIRESRKIGQFIAYAWIEQKLADALK